jgi:heat shock protein HslJ
MEVVMKQYAKVPVLVVIAILSFAACKSGPKFSDVTGKDWNLIEVQVKPHNIDFDRGKLVEEGFGDIFTLRFDTERVNGVGAPNHYFAPYTLENNQAITISAVSGTTIVPLHEPEKLKEHDFFFYLQNTARWNLKDGNLELHTKGEDDAEVILIFAPAGSKK